MPMRIVAAEYTVSNLLKEGPLALLVLIIFAATGVLVAVRGADRKTAHWLALFLAGYALQMAFYWFSDVAVSPRPCLRRQPTGRGRERMNTYMILLLVSHFPPFASGFRRILRRLALPVIVLAASVQLWIYLSNAYPGAQLFAIAGSPSPQWFQNLVWAAISVLTLVATVEGLLRVDEEHRAQMRWVGGALILSETSWLIINISLMIDPNPTSMVPLDVAFPGCTAAGDRLRHSAASSGRYQHRLQPRSFVQLRFACARGAVHRRRVAGRADCRTRFGERTQQTEWLGKPCRWRSRWPSAFRHARFTPPWKKDSTSCFLRGAKNRSLRSGDWHSKPTVVTDKRSLLDLTYESVRDNIESRYAAVYIESAPTDGRDLRTPICRALSTSTIRRSFGSAVGTSRSKSNSATTV